MTSRLSQKGGIPPPLWGCGYATAWI